MFEYPRYEEDGSEELSFPNIWMDGQPQEILGADCFTPRVDLNPLENLVTLKLTAQEFTEMFSALYTGAIITYPDKYLQVMVNFLKGIHCPPEMQENECKDFPPYAPFIEYPLQNPYSEPDLIPDGYLIPPMTVVTPENSGDYPDSEIGDVVVNFNSFPLDSGWFDDLHEDMPSLLIRVSGTGTVGVEFTPMVQGGLAIVTLDNPPNLVDILGGIITGADNIVDVNKDTLSVPPETADQIIFPVEVDTAGDHIIYVVFFPIIDDSFIPLRFGGGIRKIEVCGFLEVPIVACEDVEDCLETSVIINTLETNIATLETNVTTITNQVNEIEDCGCGGNTYPEGAPSYEDEGVTPESSAVCGAAYYIAAKLLAHIASVLSDAETISLDEFLENFLTLGGFQAGALKILWDYVIANAYPTLAAEVAATQDIVAEAFFCNLLDRDLARAEIEANTTLSAEVKATLLSGLDSVSDGKLAMWAFVGGEANEADCSGMCEWVIAWDFDGSYVPQDDENAIYTGDHWVPSGATYSGAGGYTGFTDVWSIGHALPPSCKVTSMQTNVNKNAPCTSVQTSVTWRGTSGTDAPSQTNEQTCLSNEPITQNWTILPAGVGAELENMLVQSDHFLCGGDNFGSQVRWIRMAGTGARPSE